jgi:hypothetical protein
MSTQAERQSTGSDAAADDGSQASKLGPLGAKRGADRRFTSLQVWVKVAVVVLYIVIATVWLPSYLMKSFAIPADFFADRLSASAWDTVLSLIASGAWVTTLAFAFWALWKAQKSDLI